MNKMEMVREISKKVPDLNRTQVRLVVDALKDVAVRELKRNKVFSFPGIVKIAVAKTPKRQERKGRNPLTGAAITIAAKPEGKKLKARFFRALKVEVGQVQEKEPKKK